MAKKISQNQLSQASECLREFGIVAFPTDTIYGIAGRSDSQEVQERLKWVKGRPEEKPFPLVVGELSQCENLVDLDDRSKKIMELWWPGELTLVLKKNKALEKWVTGGKDTVAIRMIDHPVISKMIKEVGTPLFLTSANQSDEPVCCDGDEVMRRLGDRIDLVVDGKHHTGMASTILDCTKEELSILREGPISLEDINKSLEGEKNERH